MVKGLNCSVCENYYNCNSDAECINESEPFCYNCNNNYGSEKCYNCVYFEE